MRNIFQVIQLAGVCLCQFFVKITMTLKRRCTWYCPRERVLSNTNIAQYCICLQIFALSSMKQVIFINHFKDWSNTLFYDWIFSQTKTKPVQMMFMRDTFLILHETTMKFKIIELPYVENELSMFVLLPDDINDNTTGLELVKLTYHFTTYSMRQ